MGRNGAGGTLNCHLEGSWVQPNSTNCLGVRLLAGERTEEWCRGKPGFWKLGGWNVDEGNGQRALKV